MGVRFIQMGVFFGIVYMLIYSLPSNKKKIHQMYQLRKAYEAHQVHFSSRQPETLRPLAANAEPKFND